MRYLTFPAVLMMAMLMLCANRTLGGNGGPRYGKGSGTSGGNGTGTSTTPPPVDHSASTDAKKKVADATVELTKDNHALADVVAKLRKEFQQKPEWIAAQTAVANDQAKLDAAHDAVLAKLQKDSNYVAMKTAKAKAETDRDALQKDGGAAEDLDRAGKAVFTASAATTKVEADAMNADLGVSDARSQLAEENRKIAGLLAEFDAANKQNADWQAASKVVEQQQQVLADARKALAAAIATEAQAERDRQKQMGGG